MEKVKKKKEALERISSQDKAKSNPPLFLSLSITNTSQRSKTKRGKELTQKKNTEDTFFSQRPHSFIQNSGLRPSHTHARTKTGGQWWRVTVQFFLWNKYEPSSVVKSVKKSF